MSWLVLGGAVGVQSGRRRLFVPPESLPRFWKSFAGGVAIKKLSKSSSLTPNILCLCRKNVCIAVLDTNVYSTLPGIGVST